MLTMVYTYIHKLEVILTYFDWRPLFFKKLLFLEEISNSANFLHPLHGDHGNQKIHTFDNNSNVA